MTAPKETFSLLSVQELTTEVALERSISSNATEELVVNALRVQGRGRNRASLPSTQVYHAEVLWCSQSHSVYVKVIKRTNGTSRAARSYLSCVAEHVVMGTTWRVGLASLLSVGDANRLSTDSIPGRYGSRHVEIGPAWS